MDDWNYINSDEDIEYLMSTYGDFHDSCLVSLNFRSGACVDNDFTMSFGNSKEYIVSVLFQSQWEPKNIMLEFRGLRQLHLAGWQNNYTCDISSAYLAIHKNLLPGKTEKVIIWSDNDWFDINKIDNTIHEPTDTYIVAEELRWRIVDEQ